MNRPIKCEITGCYRDAVYFVGERHSQEDGTIDAEYRATCEIHGRQEIPQNLTLLSTWQIIQCPDRRCNA